jgi:serine/threonine protein kinase
LGSFSENEARLIFIQLCNAVGYLHQQNIVHRYHDQLRISNSSHHSNSDLKPENILFESKKSTSIKLTDFGLARFSSSSKAMQTICGTPQYLGNIETFYSLRLSFLKAPEVFLYGETVASNNSSTSAAPSDQLQGYSKAVDVWSMGVILFIM